MLENIEKFKKRHAEVQALSLDPALIKNQREYKKVMQEYAHLSELIEAHAEYTRSLEAKAEAEAMLGDPEMKDMAAEELAGLNSALADLESRLKILLIPPDPVDSRHTIIEIRAGTGGDEAALFAADLFRMYNKFVEKQGWSTEVLSLSETEIGGLKEAVFAVKGKNAYGTFRFESGGHRVQRVPTTESGGRVHTSACTVAVLPEAEETDISINESDLRIDVFRSSGPGGQSVNTTDSAVRITHLPTGLVVSCQDEKSQHKNRAKALRVLSARLYEMEESKRRSEEAAQRKSQIGSGDRSQRIRTYNFPQNRLTDHRIGLTIHKLDQILEGDLGEVINALKLRASEEALQGLE